MAKAKKKKKKPKAQPEGEEKVGNKKPPRIHQFGAEQGNRRGNGPEQGVRYFKPALKRFIKKYPRALDIAVKQLFEDAKGLTRVAEGERITPADRQRALMILRDTLDGKPVQEIDVAGAPTTLVVVAHATGGMDPELSDEIAAIVYNHEDEAVEAVDLSNPHPENEEEPDDEP